MDRVTPLGGCPNFRHLGGYAAAHGRVTRADRLFRTGWFRPAEGDEAEDFAARAIDTLFDFRTDAERARQPFDLPCIAADRIVSLPIQHGSMAGYLQSISATSSSPEDSQRAMAAMYRETVRHGVAHFSQMFRLARQSKGLMVACSLGKDRTGIASALILAALGVAKADIFDDYLISDEVYRDRAEGLYATMQFASRGIPLDLVRDVLTVRQSYLDAAWDEMQQVGGSVEGFLQLALGVDAAAREDLVQAFTA